MIPPAKGPGAEHAGIDNPILLKDVSFCTSSPEALRNTYGNMLQCLNSQTYGSLPELSRAFAQNLLIGTVGECKHADAGPMMRMVKRMPDEMLAPEDREQFIRMLECAESSGQSDALAESAMYVVIHAPEMTARAQVYREANPKIVRRISGLF